ncbi:MAG TPA: DUF6807 family protein [Prolixibacteraceae bacterium]
MLKGTLLLLLSFCFFAANAQIHLVVKEGGFLFLEGKDSIFFYQKSPKDKAGEYSRCNYIHPLYGLDNSRLTEDFPSDHLHHRGVFWAWHQVLIDTMAVSDGWELKNFQQKVVDFEFLQQKGIGYLNTTLEWKSPLWKNGAEAYLRENTTIILYPKVGNYRRLDFEIKLNALADRLNIGGSDDEKGYGGFSVRLKLPSDVTFTGENGLVEPLNTAISAGNLMNISGSFLAGGKKGGVVMECNPQNPAPATSWILRRSASMQNAVYPGRQPVSIPMDQPLVLKYSLLVYQGTMNKKQIVKALK